MNEDQADTATDTEATTETETTVQADTDWQAEAEKWKSQARKHEARAKDNAKAKDELEQLRQQSMTETERAVEQARLEARTATLTEVGGRIATAELRAAAAGRLGPEQLETLIDGLNLAAFLDDEGEVDRDKVTQFIDGIAPPADDRPAPQTFPDLGQGARGNGTAGDDYSNDPLYRDLKSKLNIR